jgi:hypothetical protein
VTIFVPRSPFGYTIFCDDVRQENNGKFLYIGVYTTEMIIYGQPPGLLPTFAAIVHYAERADEQGDDIISLKMFVPGMDQPISELPVDPAAMKSVPLPPPLEVEDRIIRASIPLKFSPFVIPQEGLIKVRAYRGEDEIRLGTLQVKFQPIPQPESAPIT